MNEQSTEREWLEGLRYEDKFSDELCEHCHGSGEIAFNPGYPDPQTEDNAPCPDCHGAGEIEQEET